MQSGDSYAAAEADFDLASCALRSHLFKNESLAEPSGKQVVNMLSREQLPRIC